LVQVSYFDIFKYFLYTGATVFGGPLAVIETMRYDLVVRKKWIKFSEFENYLGYAQIAPGPLAFQVCVYMAYFKKGFFGGLLAAIGLVLPSFILVLIFSVFYSTYKDITYVKYCLYGLGPVIIAVIFHSGFKLTNAVLKKDVFLYLLFAASIALTIFFKVYIIFLIIGSALISLVYYLFKENKISTKKINSFLFFLIPALTLVFTKVILLVKDIAYGKLLEIALLFLKIGSLTYGSGFVIVGVLRQEIVDNLHWLTSKEFIDGIAFGQITPGPVVITSTFIGYLTQGFSGSLVATACIFLPSFIFVLILAQKIEKYKDNFYLKAFIKGANAASIGAILSTAYLLSKDAILDIPTFILFVSALPVLFFTKFKSIYVILISAAIGIIIRIYVFP
jgi:chromate transporter